MPYRIVRDDITHLRADAIVNAANEQLLAGGGVCGAIFHAAGARQLQAACNRIGHCDTGSAVATPAYRLHAKYVIHAVGPIWQGGGHNERELLAGCYRRSLELADELHCRSIAFPLISAGIYGYPRREALAVAQGEIRRFLNDHEMDVTLVLFDAGSMELADDLRLRVERFIDDVYADEHTDPRRRLEGQLSGPVMDGYAWSNVFSDELELDEAFDERMMAKPAESAAPQVSAAMPSAPAPAAMPGAAGGDSFCPTCGATVEAGATYCPYCGHRMDGTESPAEFDAVEKLATIPDPISYAAPAAGAAPAPSAPGPAAMPAPVAASQPVGSHRRGGLGGLRDLLKHMDAGFSETLMAMIDERGLRDAEVYKRANISRQHFSKIRSNPRYRPTKQTVLALAVAMELPLDQTQMLLERAGFALSHADRRDIIVEFFIREGNYDVFEINDTLFAFDQPLLG